MGSACVVGILPGGASLALDDFALRLDRPSSSRPPTMNVLLVDDESLARRRLRRLLSDATDVTVVAECGSGGPAIEALKTHQDDVVFLDIQMPGVDGFVVAKSLQGPEAPLPGVVTAPDIAALRAF